MKKNIPPNDFRILAVAPSTRGFGFAVLEGRDTLVDWGLKSVNKEAKNAESLEKVGSLIAQYQPGVVVLEDVLDLGSRRSPRICKLCQQIAKLASTRKVTVKAYPRNQLINAFIPDGEGTKYALAEVIAKQFPEELGSTLPPKRRAWESEDARMNIFDAVALALIFRTKRKQ